MTQKSKTILFFGTEDFSAYSLEMLIKHGFLIGAIITKPDTRRGRSKQLTKPRVKELGETYNIPVWQPHKLSDIADNIRQFDSPVGVLVSFGKIIPQSIIDLFTPGIINLHPSLLPKYRGPSPIEAAILNGDAETGISIMQLSAAMDAGPVYSQEKVALHNTETAPELYEALGRRGATLLMESLPGITDGSMVPSSQDNAAVTYCQLITKADGSINWHNSAIQIEREIRAYQSWPGSRTTLGTVDVIITKAHTSSDSGEPGRLVINSTPQQSLGVYAQTGCLIIDQLKPIGKKEMPVQAFLAGYKNKLT